MDHAARPAASDDPTNDATSANAGFAEADRVRIAERNARLAVRLADPAAAAAADARWQAENAEAIEASKAWYAANGHPLAGYLCDSDHPLAAYFGDRTDG